MDTDKIVTATFVQKSFTITASAGTNGTITPDAVVNVNWGASQTFTITPNPGAAIGDVLVDGTSVGPVTSYTFNNITNNHTISAVYLCPSLRVRVIGSDNVVKDFYGTIQDAYNHPTTDDDDVIQAQAISRTETFLTFNRNIKVTLEGGYLCDYLSNAGRTTNIKGQIHISAGTVKMKNIVLNK